MVKRARLLTDHTIIGEGSPMYTTDQQPIDCGTILYQPKAIIDQYDFEVEAYVVAWVVTQVNYKMRYIRMRNAEGREETRSYEEGSPDFKVYASLDGAYEEASEELSKESKFLSEKIEEHKARYARGLANILRAKEALPTKRPKIPPY